MKKSSGLGDKEMTIKKLKEDIQNKNKQITDLDVKMEELEIVMTKKDKEIEKFQKRCAQLENDVSELNNQVENLERNGEAGGSLNFLDGHELKEKVERLEKENRTLKTNMD